MSHKQILITGGTGFFGRYITGAFLEAGARVIILGRSDNLHKQVEKYINEYGSDRIFGYRVDFYDREKLQGTLCEISKNHDIDVLMNNAYDFSEKTGFNTPEGRLENSSYEQWKSAFECGIYWHVLATQIIGNRMKDKKKKGSIINISSMYGMVSPSPKLYEGTDKFNPPTYSVMKAGLIALTRYTASFWAADGIRCNALAPGPFSNVESDGPNAIKSDEPFLEKLRANTLLGRLGHPNDLLGALLFLASDDSSYMTGQVIVIDGGWTVR